MSKESFLSKLKNLENYTFLLPILQEEITYRKLDVIEAAVSNQLPNFISAKVLDVMKKGLVGDEQAEEITNPELNKEDVKELLIKATDAWKKCVIEPKLTDEEIIQIPSEDRLAWFMNAIAQSHSSNTVGGGEVTAADVASFPVRTTAKRNTKRSSNS